MSKTRWYFNSGREFGENCVSGPVGCLCPLSLYTPLEIDLNPETFFPSRSVIFNEDQDLDYLKNRK